MAIAMNLSAENLAPTESPLASNPKKILIIRLSALGDIISSLGPMMAIRRHHPQATITLLTTRPFLSLLEPSGVFDEIWCDDRAPWYQLIKIAQFRNRLAKAGFARIYDLQTSSRTARYFQIWPNPKPEWSGHAVGASHCDLVNPNREISHTLDRQKYQLALAGITDVPEADLGYLPACDLGPYNLPKEFALIVPGCSASQAWKRWPTTGYIDIAHRLSGLNLTPILIGTEAEADLCAEIQASVPSSLNLNGQTNLLQLVNLARHCRMAIGNDTGPMHMIAASGKPILVLTSSDLVRHKTAPRGRFVRQLTGHKLSDIAVEKVWEEMTLLYSVSP